jgi:hypothetical protein
LASRSYSLTRLSTVPAASTTGTPLTRCRRELSATSPTEVSGATVITGVVIMSPAVLPAVVVSRGSTSQHSTTACGVRDIA